MDKKAIYLLHLKNYPIIDQLRLEEALLRTDDRSFYIINEGSPRSIIMGISSKAEELIDLKKAQEHKIPVIRRYSGGGCVIVDDNTLFTSFVMSKKDLTLSFFPEPILRWTGDFYQKASGLDSFSLRENDYAIGNMKCGGNAQYLQKERWVHHTTFLWDYAAEAMDFLLFPNKVPDYRKKRSHIDFLCKLKEHIENKNHFVDRIKKELELLFSVKKVSLEELLPSLDLPHRKATKVEL